MWKSGKGGGSAIRKAEVEESFFKVWKINLTPKNFDKRNRLCSNVLKLEAIKEIKRTVASVEFNDEQSESRSTGSYCDVGCAVIFYPVLFLSRALNLSRALTWESEECKITQRDAMLLPEGPSPPLEEWKHKSGDAYTTIYPPSIHSQRKPTTFVVVDFFGRCRRTRVPTRPVILDDGKLNN
ncbi:hypothetical protein K0M31_002984 [Melipona bicolor]|uniref:Uncharacterized protein n=1 Tax=Melipona bicolor TaxID=60889 RepID=A0AA40G023_9HYME|nr:hypothetical protein K0M31_002984 [Melipona bicolor]